MRHTCASAVRCERSRATTSTYSFVASRADADSETTRPG